MLIRLETKPQGALFTGTVEPSLAGGGSTWSLYRTDNGRRCWWAVTDDGRGSWWEEKPDEDWKASLPILHDREVVGANIAVCEHVLLRKFSILGRVFVVDGHTIDEDGQVTLRLKPEEVQGDARSTM